MKSAKIIKILLAMTLLILVSLTGILDAQRSLHLRLPYNGTYRTTSYVDHRTPNYNTDGNMYVYNDEEYPDCAGGGTFTGPYCYDGHDGMDYALPCGTPVLAAAAGTVSFVGWDYGNTVIINHGDGYTTFYGHLQTGSFNVNVNDIVQAGQQIALSNNTGNSGGCHLHFGVYHNGLVIDPFGWTGSGTDPISQPNTGGEASSCHWDDGQCFDVLVEDGSYRFNEFDYGSNWNWSTGGNSWTQHYVPNTYSILASSAYYRPNLPYAGPYSVYVWIPANHATTTNATYQVYDRNGYHYIPVNQSTHSDEWVYLGGFDFWKGVWGSVYLNSNTGETSGSREVGFDSVRFRQYRLYLPAILKN